MTWTEILAKYYTIANFSHFPKQAMTFQNSDIVFRSDSDKTSKYNFVKKFLLSFSSREKYPQGKTFFLHFFDFPAPSGGTDAREPTGPAAESQPRISSSGAAGPSHYERQMSFRTADVFSEGRAALQVQAISYF
ncbi:hypothetical protein F2P81_013371 [Scophthalmus maximus]|uniref:Uncharacterized protein n=1 Tax=Scophthalmus maximus TaxID=52904 RepID=A0A6A4SNQ2_SCOMX|nr:hypothetical protein F2P81_013371 [Scophthalmus maximus]